MTAQTQLLTERFRGVGLHVGRPRIATLLLAALYPLLLLWIYRLYVAPAYPNVAYEYHSPDHPWLIVVATLGAVAIAALLPLELNRPGAAMLWIMYTLAYVPSLVMPIVRFDMRASEFLWLHLGLVASMAILIAMDRLPPLRLPSLRLPAWLFWLGFGAAYAASTALIVRHVGVPTSLPSFGEVYDVRFEFIDRVAEMPRHVSYLWAWQGQVLNPFLIAWGFARRSWLPLAIGTLGQVMLYGSSGEKSQLFVIALIVGVYLLALVARPVFGVLVAAGACLLTGVSVILDAILSTEWFMGLFIQRLTVTPGLLTGAYYEYFSDHPKALLGYSVLGPFFDYPYDTTIPYVMGREFFDSPRTVANANIWADGFANFGFGGIVLVSLIAGVIIWGFNSVARGPRFLLGVTLAAAAAMVWTNISVFTSMITHGIPLTLALVWLAPLPERRGAAARDGSR